MIAGISLQTANLYGYIHCKLGGQKSISRVTSRFFVTADVPKSKYRVGLSATAHEVSHTDLPHAVGFGSSQVLAPKVNSWQGYLASPISLSCGSHSEAPSPMSLRSVQKPAEASQLSCFQAPRRMSSKLNPGRDAF